MKKKHQKVCFRFRLSEIFYYFCNGFVSSVSFVLKLCYKVNNLQPNEDLPGGRSPGLSKPSSGALLTERKVTKKNVNLMILTTLIKL